MDSMVNQQPQRSIPFVKNLCLLLLLMMSVVFFYPINHVLHQTVALVVPLLVLFCVIILNIRFRIDKWTAEIYVFLALWLVYGLIGLAWAKDTGLALYHIRHIMIYLLVFVLFSQLFKKAVYRSAAHLMVQVFLYGYCLIYIWEMITWQHLPNSRLYGIPLPVPTGVYFNENNSAMFIMLLAPFLTIKTYLTRGKAGKLIAVVALLFMTAAAGVQNSRLAVVIMLMLGIYFFIRAGHFARMVSVVILILSLVVFITYFPKEYKAISQVLSHQISYTLNEHNSYLMTSSKIRSRLNLESINLAMESKLFGVGAGGYEIYLRNSRYHRTSWVVNPHNWWLENLASYGLLIFLGIVFIYIRWLLRLWKLRQSAGGKRFREVDVYFISLLLFIPFSMIPSSIKWFYSVWIYFGLVHAFCLAADGSGQGCSASTDNELQLQASA